MAGILYSLRLFAMATLAGAVVAAEAHALDAELYARVLERYTVPVTDIASTRVDYAALRNAEPPSHRQHPLHREPLLPGVEEAGR